MKRRVTVLILTLLLSVMSTLALNVQYVKAEPTTWTVDDDGPADFSSIQDAINEASPGDTIHVRNGTYYENVVVNKTVALFGEKRDFTIIDGGGVGHVILVTANDVTLSGFTIQRGRSESPFCGVQLDNVHGSSVNNNLVTDNYHGISTFWSIRNTISDNTLIENAYGIGLYYSYPHTENGENMVANNEITSHWLDGIYVWNSMGNSIINNTVSNSGYGIRISGSDGNVLRDNKMIDNSYNFGVDGWELSEFIQDIDSSNVIDEKPVYYLINQGKLTIDPATFPDIGFLGLVNSTDVTVKNLNISSNLQGILFAFTNSSNIENVRVTNNVEGIILSGSSNNTISHNMATSNWVGIRLDNSDYNILSHNAMSSNNLASGIYLFESDANTIANNILESNMGWGGGITLGWSSSNIIKGNDILENTCAFDISYSDDNTVYHNNILNNTIQVNSESSINLWDDGFPSGGNHWSDYTGTDADDDGIGDTPYDIDVNNLDNYPLICPWSSVERKVGVEVGDWVKYSNFNAAWSSNDPDSEIPLGIALLQETEWWQNSVEEVLDTKIRYQQLFHFKNGSELATTCWIDIDTASGTPVSFISSGLNPSDNLYSSAPWFAWKLNETQTRSYVGVLRETNWLNITASMQIGPPPPYSNSTGNFYWDRETGVVCELSMKHVNKTGSYVTSWSVFYEIVDTNLWEAPIPTTIDDLKTEIEDLGSEGEIDNQGIVRSLIAKLKVAEKLVDKGKTDEAVMVLEDFIMQVQELSGIRITVEAADILIQSAEYILSNL